MKIIYILRNPIERAYSAYWHNVRDMVEDLSFEQALEMEESRINKMSRKLYVGNLSFSVTEQSLNDTFSQCGNVESAKLIMDRDSGRSKGFGFVEMSSDEEAKQAIEKFDGQDNDGRPMKVNEAKPMEPRRGGGGRY